MPPAGARLAGTLTLLAMGALAAGCSHREAAGQPSPPAQSAASSYAGSALAVASGPREDDVASERERWLPSPWLEARRTTLLAPEDDASLAPFAARVREHFADGGTGALSLEVASAGGGRVAMLVFGEPPSTPLVLVTDASGARLEWSKDRPLAGTRGGSTEIALVAGPHGEVGLAWYDAPTHVVALRRWHADGGVLGDFELLDVDACNALSAIYWPGRGWVAVAAQPGFALAQRLDEQGTLAWGREGRNVAAGVRAGGAVSLALDLDVSLMLLQLGHAGGPPARGDAPHLLATRLDGAGERLWQAPLDLGEAPPRADRERVVLERARPGLVRVTLGGLDAEIGSTGHVSFLRQAR